MMISSKKLILQKEQVFWIINSKKLCKEILLTTNRKVHIIIDDKFKVAIIGIKSLPASFGADRVVESLIENVNSKNLNFYVYHFNEDNIPSNSSYKSIKVPKLFFGSIASFFGFLYSSVHAILFCKYDLINVHNIDCGFILSLIHIWRCRRRG